jgi:hypothetical protein
MPLTSAASARLEDVLELVDKGAWGFLDRDDQAAD